MLTVIISCDRCGKVVSENSRYYKASVRLQTKMNTKIHNVKETDINIESINFNLAHELVLNNDKFQYIEKLLCSPCGDIFLESNTTFMEDASSHA